MIGEWMAVASANRGVLGGFDSDDEVDAESAVETELADMVRAGGRLKLRAAGRFFSSETMVVGEHDSKRAHSDKCLC